MNYRHLYHAGSFADVVKHATLVLLLQRLRAKDKPFIVIDTHAGAGLYDLWAPEAGRSGEWRTGIQRLMAAAEPPREARPYLAAVRARNPGDGLRWYPGSPLLAASLLRPQDRLIAIERHPEEAAALRAALSGFSRTEIRLGDGYAALKALLPPSPRRGLVVIDPPYEEADEIDHLARALRAAWRRWATGHYLIWYPTKDPALVAALHRAAAELKTAPALVAELKLPAPPAPDRLSGCGLLLLNPPWRLDEALSQLLPALAALLGGAGSPAGAGAPVQQTTLVRPLMPAAAPAPVGRLRHS